MKYKIKKIREDFLQKLRIEGLDDLNQKVVYLIAQGGEPCRDVLRRARVGEELILASYALLKKMVPTKSMDLYLSLLMNLGKMSIITNYLLVFNSTLIKTMIICKRVLFLEPTIKKKKSLMLKWLYKKNQ